MIMSSAEKPRLEPIAERRLVVIGQPERQVSIVLGKPYPDSDPSGDWICPVQLCGIADDPVFEVHGLDAIQALMLALEKARVELANSGASVTWAGGEWQGDIGIPRAVPHFYGREFAERVGRLVDVEIERLSEDLAKARAK